MSVNQSATTGLSKSTSYFFASSKRAENISRVIGLHCLTIFSSLSLARMIIVHMLEWSNKSAGMSRLQSQNKVLIASTYSQTVAEQELWSNISCSMKHAMIFSKPDWLPQGSEILCILVNLMYTACLNLVVSSSWSDLNLDIFASTICPIAARLACDLAERNCRLSTPCVPVESWSSRS